MHFTYFELLVSLYWQKPIKKDNIKMTQYRQIHIEEF